MADHDRFDSLPEYRPDEMIPLSGERLVTAFGDEIGQVFRAHGDGIRGVPRDVAERAGVIASAQQAARQRGWTLCRRRDRYLIIAVPDRAPDH